MEVKTFIHVERILLTIAKNCDRIKRTTSHSIQYNPKRNASTYLRNVSGTPPRWANGAFSF